MSLPEKILVRPAMQLWLFVKKHPWLSLLLLGLIWLLPPLVVLWIDAINKLIDLTERLFKNATRTANMITSTLKKVRDWFTLSDNPAKRFWLVPLALGLLFPPLGVFLAAWHFVDTIKTSRAVTDLSVTAPTVQTPEPENTGTGLDYDPLDFGFPE